MNRPTMNHEELERELRDYFRMAAEQAEPSPQWWQGALSNLGEQKNPRRRIPLCRPRWFRVLPATRLAWAFAAVALFMMLGAATYAAMSPLGERLFSQVMGRWGQDYQAELTHEVNLSQTIKGITVTLERAYFDDNRIGIEYTVSGLPERAADDPQDFQPEAALVDGMNPPPIPASRAAGFPMVGGSGVRADSQIQGMEIPPDMVKEVVGFDVTEAQADASGMQLRFVVSIVASVFVFDFKVPFTPSKDVKVIEVGQMVEAAGVPVRLEQVTITPAEVRALLWVDRSPEQARMGVSPAMVMLTPPGGWTSDKPQPPAYLVTMLGDSGNFAAKFHNDDSLLDMPGEWTLTVNQLRGASDQERRLDEVIDGPWVFRFEVP